MTILMLTPILGPFGGNQLITALDAVIPNFERRLDNIVVMVASPVPRRCAKR